jgi:formamidopyrimidine-DNA glycosylase
MPELPDINAYLCALDARIVGQTLGKVRVASAFVLRTESAIVRGPPAVQD